MRFPEAAIALAALSLPFTVAFTPATSASTCVSSSTTHRIITATSALHMSDDDDLDDLFGEEDDALSALIGKRAQMYKEKPKEKPKVPVTEEEIDAKLDEIEKKVADYDYMDDLPEFTSKRPLRTPKKKEKEEKKDDDAADTDEVIFMDYQADYDDENELHIPNRMGFGTAGWGDVKSGFKEGKKLKKKEIKAGRYLAGDLQVSFGHVQFECFSFEYHPTVSHPYGIILHTVDCRFPTTRYWRMEWSLSIRLSHTAVLWRRRIYPQSIFLVSVMRRILAWIRSLPQPLRILGCTCLTVED